MLTSISEENELGLQAWNEIRRTTPVCNDQKMNAALKRVGSNIARAVDNQSYQWEFVVFQSDEANAFCLPGGKVGVYSGLFKYLDNDSELAAVVGHEAGHAVARHGGERMSQEYMSAVGATALAVALGGNSEQDIALWTLAYAGVSQLGYILPYSREHEYEADRLGLIFMSKAGYDPKGTVTFWNKFSQVGTDDAISEFFSTHPMSSKRMEQIKANLPEAYKFYDDAPKKIGMGTA